MTKTERKREREKPAMGHRGAESIRTRTRHRRTVWYTRFTDRQKKREGTVEIEIWVIVEP